MLLDSFFQGESSYVTSYDNRRVCFVFGVSERRGCLGDETYTFTAMNPAGSDTMAYPMAMNLVNGVPLAAGVTGGGATNLNQGYPCIWNSAGVGTNVLSYIPGSPTRGKAWGMDPSGDIVGNEKVSSGQKAYFLAYGSTSGVTLPQVNSSDAYAIAYAAKDSSTVVGTEGVASSSAYGVIWTKTGSTWAVAALPGLGGTYWAATRTLAPTPSPPTASSQVRQ